MSSQEYTKRIVQAMSGVLEPVGFVRKGTAFTAEREDLIWFVDLWKSKFMTRDEFQGGAGYGLFCPAFEQECVRRGARYSERADRPTDEDECHWSREWPAARW